MTELRKRFPWRRRPAGKLRPRAADPAPAAGEPASGAESTPTADFPMAARRRMAWTSAAFRPFRRFFRLEAASGVLLLAMALLAIVWANSPFAGTYFRIWSLTFTVGPDGMVISKPLLLWINDGLMAIFFFLVGLEIKREVLIGELSSPKKAALPVSAALGGMVVPALIYTTVNAGTPGARGWGIPMATDIAFALGVVALLGKRVPLVLKVFLTAVAVADDLGSVLVIALFYTSDVSLAALGAAGLTLGVLVLANRFGIRRPAFYTLLGVLLWVALLRSGVHATVAGVLLAMVIPASWRVDPVLLQERAWSLLQHLGMLRPELQPSPKVSREALHSLEKAVREADVPLSRMEHSLHPWVAFGIMPLFALANAGVPLRGEPLVPVHPVTLGVLLGLFFGKQAGVLLFSWLAVRFGLADLPAGVRWRQMYGMSLLTGIGFTMSLFIAGLAFGSGPLLDAAKVGILAASLLSGICGWLVLVGTGSPAREEKKGEGPLERLHP